MNKGDLHELCKKTTRKEFERFKYVTNNPLFELNHEYINQVIEHMTVEIGTSIMGKYYHQLESDMQFKMAFNVIERYKAIAEATAWRCGCKKLKV